MASRARQRAGGRSEQVRLAVGRAVHDLLGEGRYPFTTAEVAERAGVNRRTLYRWWPSQGDLLTEALAHHVRQVEVSDTGSLEGDVRALARGIAVFAAGPADLTMTRIMVSGRHPDFNAAVVDHFRPLMAQWRAVFERAAARGEAGTTHDSTTIVSALVSPLFLAPLTSGEPTPVEAVDRLVDLVLDAIREPR